MSLKLSELLLEGAQGKEQIIGCYFAYDLSYEVVLGCCAIGSIALGYGNHQSSHRAPNECIAAIFRDFPALDDVVEQLPEFKNTGALKSAELRSVITILNDCEKWSFEQIANWLKAQGL